MPAAALVLASIPLAAILNLLTLPQLFVTAFLSGVLTVFFDVAYLSYVPILVGRDELIDANARLGLGASFAQVAGPGLAGLLVQLLGAARAIAADSGSFVASALSLLWIGRREDRPDVRRRRGVARELIDGLRFVSSHRLLRAQIVLIAYTVLEVRPKSPTGPLAPMRPVASPLRGGPFPRAFCAPRVRIANARAPVLGGPSAFGPPGPQMPRPGFRPHL